jgi:hypothetical protein
MVVSVIMDVLGVDDMLKLLLLPPRADLDETAVVDDEDDGDENQGNALEIQDPKTL